MRISAFFARFKFRKLHTTVFKSAAILPRNGKFVLMTSTNDRTVNQSISRWCYYTPRSISMTIFSPCEILSYRRVDNALSNFPSIFEPALKIVLKVANEFQKHTALKIALTYIKSRRCIALKKYRYKSSYVTCITFKYGREPGCGEEKKACSIRPKRLSSFLNQQRLTRYFRLPYIFNINCTKARRTHQSCVIFFYELARF